MIEKPPSFGSKRFREILVPAFKGDALKALVGVYLMATRRRVRGWTRLMLAASEAPLNYRRWTRHGEMRAFAEFRRIYPVRGDHAPIVGLLLDQGAEVVAVETTRQSLRDAFGHSENVLSSSGDDFRASVSQLAKRNPSAWALPVVAGDQVSPSLGDVLSRKLSAGDQRLVYWDEDQSGVRGRSNPWVKPDWDPLLFSTLAGLLGSAVVPILALEQSLNAFPERLPDERGLEDLLFQVAQKHGAHHVPLILTHRSKSREPSDSPRRPSAPRIWPSVSIIVPTRDKPELLAACIQGIEQTDYAGPLQVIIVDNGSRDRAALDLMQRCTDDPRMIVIRDDGAFNFSRLNNVAAALAEGDVLCLLNNDVEPMGPDWLSELVRYAVQQGVGAVGPQLVYPSGRIQHAGVAIGLGGAAGHIQKGTNPEALAFNSWHAVTREVSAVTAAVLVVKKSLFKEVGGLDEQLPVAFNDVDFCLRLKQRGLRNIYVADVRLVHRESESRGRDRSPVQAQRFARELALLQARWETEDYYDPHFSPLFSRLAERCVLAP